MKKLWRRIKNFLKRFWPLTIYRFDQKYEAGIKQSQRETTHHYDQGIIKEIEEIKQMQEQIIHYFDQRTAKEVEEIIKIQKKIDVIETRDIRCMPRGELLLEFHMAEHCNLNCAGCGHFSPLAEPEFADYEETSRDFARLSFLFHGHIRQLRLMGGEPLLHPDLIKFLKMARENFPYGDIAIVTNGILLLNQPEEFWLACKENKISIRPTKYPIPLDFEEIEKRAADYGVLLRYYGNSGTVIKTLSHFRKDLMGLQDSNRSFRNCGNANVCTFLQHGRLYTCALPALSRHFNKYFGKELKELPEDSIDIYQAGSAREVLDFLARPIPFCRYCMIGAGKSGIPWHQSERVIEEWT